MAIGVIVGRALGAAYIFRRSGRGWTLEDTLVDNNTDFKILLSYDYFGWSVSLSGDRLAVGAYGDQGHDGSGTGAAYIFKRTGSDWGLEKIYL